MNSTQSIDAAPANALLSLPRLRADLQGQVMVPGDAGYDPARVLFYGGHDHRPAVIIRPVDAAEVAYVIALARATGLPLAVRSGGHGAAGHSVIEGGIVLDLAAMRALEIDVPSRTAWAEAGLTTGEYTVAAAAHGLATGFGDTATVGLGGLTLGGGVGYLVRKHGLAIDNLLAVDLVTADGQLLRADAETHPDLFWALRGGGGNFGVAVRFQFRLHPVDPFVGGMLILPATAEVIHGFLAAAAAAPDELSTIANIMPAPPMPFLAPELVGSLVLLANMAYAGDAEAGQRALAPFRALAEPIADFVRPMTYPEMFPPEEGDYHPLAYGLSLFMDSFDLRDAEAVMEHLRASTAMLPVAQLRVLGGAAARVPVEATAYAHRARPIMVNVAALYENPQDAPLHEAAVARFAAVLAKGDNAAYVNFLANEGPERVRAAYPGATWDRLAAVKARYDPSNLFRGNHNIPPAAAVQRLD